MTPLERATAVVRKHVDYWGHKDITGFIEDVRVAIVETTNAELEKRWAAEAEVKRLTEILDQYRWRPIAEIHEDYGQCVLMQIDDPGYMKVGSNVDMDFNELEWTHFAQVPKLTTEEAERLIEEMGSKNA